MSSVSFEDVHIFSKTSLAIFPEIVESSILLIKTPSCFAETLDSIIFRFSLFNSAKNSPIIQLADNLGELDSLVTSSKKSAKSLSAAKRLESYLLSL